MSLNQISERQNRVAGRATRSFTRALLAPLFAATSFSFELVEQQLVFAKQLNDIFVESPSKAILGAPNAQLARTADDAALAAARKTIDEVAQAFVTAADDAEQAFVTPADDAAPGLVATAESLAMTADDAIVHALVTPPADDASPALVKTTDEDQEIQLRAERLVIDKQRQQGEARVRKEIVTETKSFDVPVSHEELVIDRQAVTGDADVDSAPIAAETIRIPLSEDKVNIAKKTVVREEVEIGKRRVEDVEHISDTVRHEELRVNNATPNDYCETAS